MKVKAGEFCHWGGGVTIKRQGTEYGSSGRSEFTTGEPID